MQHDLDSNALLEKVYISHHHDARAKSFLSLGVAIAALSDSSPACRRSAIDVPTCQRQPDGALPSGSMPSALICRIYHRGGSLLWIRAPGLRLSTLAPQYWIRSSRAACGILLTLDVNSSFSEARVLDFVRAGSQACRTRAHFSVGRGDHARVSRHRSPAGHRPPLWTDPGNNHLGHPSPSPCCFVEADAMSPLLHSNASNQSLRRKGAGGGAIQSAVIVTCWPD